MNSLSTVATVQLRYSNNVYHQAEDAEPGLGEENIMIGTQQCRWGERPNLGTKWQKWCKNQSINACLSDTPMIMLCDRRYASVRGSSASKAGDQAEDGDAGVE